MSENNIAVKVEHVSKYFKLPTEATQSLRTALVNRFKGIKGYKEQHVLKDISFEVEKGDFFGIVGRNGSGKSTLLKIISQIYTPEKGKVTVNGKMVSFIELGVGFNPELTGRENVYLNGAMLGFTTEEIDSMYDDIVEFAELEEFMNQKLKNYSSGMQVRLAFSVAIKAQGDVLILDEVLAVGDEAFQRKCNDYFNQIKEDKSKTIILVTHAMSSVRKYCNKAIMISEGEIVANGSIDEVVETYTKQNFEVREKVSESSEKTHTSKYPTGLNELVPKLKLQRLSESMVSGDQDFEFEVDYHYTGDEEIYLAVAMYDTTRGGIVYDSSEVYVDKGEHKVKFAIPMTIFNSTEFKLTASIRSVNETDKDNANLIGFTNDENSLSFILHNEDEHSDYSLIERNKLGVKIVKDTE